MDDPALRFAIVGERVALGPLRPELYPLHVEWVNDPEVAWNVFGRHEPRTLAEERAWLEREAARPENRFWLVYRRDHDHPIGVTSLTDIGVPPGTATFRILIGAAADRGQGFGEEASRLVIRPRLRRARARPHRAPRVRVQQGARRLYRRLGFRERQRRRDRIHRDGRTWDVIIMALDSPRRTTRVVRTGWKPTAARSARPSSVTSGSCAGSRARGGASRATSSSTCRPARRRRAAATRSCTCTTANNLFDDATSFSGEWRVDETLAALAAEGIELIVVGIPNAGDEARGAEYTPYRARPGRDEDPSHLYASGIGLRVRALRSSTRSEPAVDAAFPTRRDREATGVMGSSWGALISLWAAVEEGSVFGLVGAMSPAITPGQGPILTRLRRLAPVPERVWVDAGDHEGSHAPTPRERPDLVAGHDPDRPAGPRRAGRGRRGRRRSPALRRGAGAIHHEEAWARRLPDALRFLFGPVR